MRSTDCVGPILSHTLYRTKHQNDILSRINAQNQIYSAQKVQKYTPFSRDKTPDLEIYTRV